MGPLWLSCTFLTVKFKWAHKPHHRPPHPSRRLWFIRVVILLLAFHQCPFNLHLGFFLFLLNTGSCKCCQGWRCVGTLRKGIRHWGSNAVERGVLVVGTGWVTLVKKSQIFLLQVHSSTAKWAQAGCGRSARKTFPGNTGISAVEAAGS